VRGRLGTLTFFSEKDKNLNLWNLLARGRNDFASRLFTIVLLAVEGSPAPNVADDKAQLTNPSATDGFGGLTVQFPRERAEKNAGLPDILNTSGVVDRAENGMERVREEFEEALKTYRRLAQNEPEIYLPNVAVTLRKLGILDRTELV